MKIVGVVLKKINWLTLIGTVIVCIERYAFWDFNAHVETS